MDFVRFYIFIIVTWSMVIFPYVKIKDFLTFEVLTFTFFF